MDQGTVFGEVIERKEAFLGYKNLDLKEPPNLHFSQGLVHGLWTNPLGHMQILGFVI